MCRRRARAPWPRFAASCREIMTPPHGRLSNPTACGRSAAGDTDRRKYGCRWGACVPSVINNTALRLHHISISNLHFTRGACSRGWRPSACGVRCRASTSALCLCTVYPRGAGSSRATVVCRLSCILRLVNCHCLRIDRVGYEGDAGILDSFSTTHCVLTSQDLAVWD